MKATDVITGTARWSVEKDRCDRWLKRLPAGCARACITSPPYYGLRDYGHPDQIGLERTPEKYVARLVEVFRQVRRVLADNGTLWLNLGDSYAGSGRGGYAGNKGTLEGSVEHQDLSRVARGSQKAAGYHERPRQGGVIGRAWVPAPKGLKQKDLMGIPWMVAFALRADGWYLRQDIIWHKPNVMPESVTDRCTKAHEYLFLLSKSKRYYFNANAIAEPCVESNDARPRMGQGPNTQYAQKREAMPLTNGKHSTTHKQAPGRRIVENVARARAEGGAHDAPFGETANKRSVWTVTTKPFKGAHFATFPPDLIEPCVKAGSAPDDIVIEPFAGSGTTLAVAVDLGRRAIGCELNPDYCPLIHRRMRTVVAPLFSE